MEQLKQKDFPLGSGNIIKAQYIYGTDIYIVTYFEGKYKVFQVNTDFPKGKKIAESKLGDEVLQRIPKYY